MDKEREGLAPGPEPRYDPEDVEHLLTRTFMHTNKLHRSLLERLFSKTGVFRSQHQLLMHIYCNPDVSQKELADFFHISAASAAVSLKKLEKGGYVERPVDANDNRFHRLRLTGKGQGVAEKSACIFREVEHRMYEGLSEADRAALSRYLELIQTNMKQMLQETESEGHKE